MLTSSRSREATTRRPRKIERRTPIRSPSSFPTRAQAPRRPLPRQPQPPNNGFFFAWVEFSRALPLSAPGTSLAPFPPSVDDQSAEEGALWSGHSRLGALWEAAISL